VGPFLSLYAQNDEVRFYSRVFLYQCALKQVHIAVSPPSTTNSAPVQNDESSLARNSTILATSSAVPSRRSGTIVLSPARIFAGTISIIWVLIIPGWGSGSSPAQSYYKDPQESAPQVIFRPKTAKPGFLGCLLREIFACNRVAAAKAVRRARISRPCFPRKAPLLANSNSKNKCQTL
jgi:hypothetical protein